VIDPKHNVTIEYCVPCNYVNQALGAATEIIDGWAPILTGVELRTGTQGRFEVTVDGELVFSKAALKRHAEPGEVARLVGERLGPPLNWKK
jgi:selenoprotein W-related protein